MKRSDITELYYITPIANIPSIMELGIVSYELSKKLSHRSLAMKIVQTRRKNKRIPSARKLHEYANLYFDAHNPMLSKRRNQNDEICILRINPSVLDLPCVIISDQNASSHYVRFDKVETGLEVLDKDKIFARFWLHPDNQIKEWDHKSAKCAEVLVPDKIEPKYILGAFVANETALQAFHQLKMSLTVLIKNDIFF